MGTRDILHTRSRNAGVFPDRRVREPCKSHAVFTWRNGGKVLGASCINHRCLPSPIPATPRGLAVHLSRALPCRPAQAWQLGLDTHRRFGFETKKTDHARPGPRSGP